MNAINGQEQEAVRQAKLDVKSEVARQLIEAMESGNTPWQKPWKSQALMPINGVSNNGYRGINRILLALQNRSSNVWMTFNQASDKGYKVRKGERGTPIVKVVELDAVSREDARMSPEGGSSDGQGRRAEGASQPAQGGDRDNREGQRKVFVLKRYFVFNAEQIEGFPLEELQAGPDPFAGSEALERAQAVVDAMKEQTGLMVIHGGDRACYIPSLHEVRMPSPKAFKTPYDRWATEFHECSHASMNERCMNRTEAIAKKWGDEAYALEELRAEISSCLLAHSTGIAQELGMAAGGGNGINGGGLPGNGSGGVAGGDAYSHHRGQHAAYLRSWVAAIKKDPMAIFSAAKDADLICDYMLGLVKKREALSEHREWIAEYDMTEEVCRRL